MAVALSFCRLLGLGCPKQAFAKIATPRHAQAQPAAPVLQVNTEGSELHLHWAEVDSAAGYRLFYAPYPYLGEATIDSIDLGTEKDFAINLWQGAAFYVALQSYDGQNQHSTYSNAGFFQIQDRGDSYRQYWRTVTKEISEQSFTSNEFLYDLMPNIADCFAGTLNQQAQFRQLDAFNQVRQLHQLPDISYDSFADSEVQQASLIQRANNFLSHTPPMGSNCYSAEGFDGSKSSNLHLSTHNSDPAGDIISYIDDASNVSNIAGVGHRRALLNPFLKFTSYGQVLGGSAVKVSDFSDSSTTDTEDIPDFIAFPYMRYPYVFFSDKTLNKKTPWSLAIVEDKDSIWSNRHNYFARAKLTVIQKDNDQQMAVADIHSDTKGFGVPNNLSWTVTDWQYDTWYSVIISDINYQSSVTDSIQYDVYIDYQLKFRGSKKAKLTQQPIELKRKKAS